MEYLCEYCKKPYLPKRTDSLYCSQSCRQLAYVLRKASSGELQDAKIKTDEEKEPELSSTTIGLTDNDELPVNTATQNNLSEDPDNQIPVNIAKDLSVKTDKKELPVKTDKDKISVNNPGPEPEYEAYTSSYLTELNAIHDQNNTWYALDGFFSKKNEAGMWVSEKYRCLVECLLVFTEMKYVELDDLKELCNAFTDVIQSRYFKYLHPSYPYIDDIQELRELVRRACLKAGDCQQITYRLGRAQKQNLIVTRFELAQFVPKRAFRELQFRKK